MKMNKWLLLVLIMALCAPLALMLGACGDDDDDDNDNDGGDDDGGDDDNGGGDDDSGSSSLEEAKATCEEWYSECVGVAIGADLFCGLFDYLDGYNDCVDNAVETFMNCLTATDCDMTAASDCVTDLGSATEDCY